MPSLLHLKFCLAVVVIAALCLSSAGCGNDDPEDQVSAADSSAVEPGSGHAFRVVLAGALVDTLEGRSRFGRVVHPETGRQLLLIELESPTDFAGGVFITRGDTLLPERGSHTLYDPEDERHANDRQYAIMYRQDMVRELHAVSGSVNFRVVSDTLIEGTFNVVMRGRIMRSMEGNLESEVSARGRFSAVPGPAGYAIGL